jgi:hypothetical protein
LSKASEWDFIGILWIFSDNPVFAGLFCINIFIETGIASPPEKDIELAPTVSSEGRVAVTRALQVLGTTDAFPMKRFLWLCSLESNNVNASFGGDILLLLRQNVETC